MFSDSEYIFPAFTVESLRSLLEFRRRPFPVVAIAGFLVTIIEQSAHVAGVERLGQLHREVGSDVGEFVVEAVSTADVVNSNQVVLSAGANHRRDRAPGDAESATLHSGPSRVDPTIA